jgi:hypothetical protein
LKFIVIGGAGFVLGHLLTSWVWRRHIKGPLFEREVRKQLQISFEAGMQVAADITTMSGHEELAGLIRRSAAEIKAEVSS